MSGRRTGERLARALVGLASRIVPSTERIDWVREWEGELWVLSDRGRSAVRPALGSFIHAFWLRRQAWGRTTMHLFRELRFAARSLGRRPLFTISAVVTLSLGLGATTAVYSVVDGVLLAPLPYPGGDRLVQVHAVYEQWGMRNLPLSPETFTVWRDRANAFESMEAYVRTHGANLVGAGAPVVVGHAQVTPGFFSELLRISPVVGRTFGGLGGSDRTDVALISESLWLERFGGRPDVVGTPMRVDGELTEIIGVLPRVAILPEIELWTPHPLRVDHEQTVLGALVTIAQLRPNVPREAARADLQSAAVQAAQAYPRSAGPFSPRMTEYRAGLVEDVRAHLLMLLGSVAAVLLIACINVANLLLARGIERSEELAVRRSLGATRAHLSAQVFAEALLMVLAGGVLGIGIAVLGLETLLRLLPEEIPLSAQVTLNGRVLVFAFGVMITTAIAVALLPIGRASRIASSGARRTASASRPRKQAGNVLLGIEVAQATALLIAAGLMVNTLWRMQTAEAGFDPEGLVFAHLALPTYAYDGEARPSFLDQLRERLRVIPGVNSVAVATATPFSGMTFMTGAEPEGGLPADAGDGGLSVGEPDDRRRAYFSRIHVDPSYPATLRLPLVEGRPLTRSDVESAARVALINETAARAYWPDRSPLGRRIKERDEWYTIVGIVGDLGHPGLPNQPVAELYLPLTRTAATTFPRPTLLVRHSGTDDAMLEHLRRAIWAVDPELPIPAVSNAEHALGANLASTRFYTLLLSLFAALATILASVGIYGVVAQSIGSREQEIGIRLALGARREGVVAMVLRESMIVVVPALAAGVVVAGVGSKLLDGLLYEVQPVDAGTYAGAAALLLIVAAGAVVIPATRAARKDPTESLRAE